MGRKSIPLRGPRPSGSSAGLTLDQVRELIRSTDPARVAEAGRAYTDAAAKPAGIRQALDEAMRHLDTKWSGPAAAEALKVMRNVSATAAELSTVSGRFGQALRSYGEKILPWYKQHLPGDGHIHTSRDDAYARKFMDRLNQRIAQTYDAMPGQLQVERSSIAAAGAVSGSAAPDGTPPSSNRSIGENGGNAVGLSSPAGSPISGSGTTTSEGSRFVPDGRLDHSRPAPGLDDVRHGLTGTSLASTASGASIPTSGVSASGTAGPPDGGVHGPTGPGGLPDGGPPGLGGTGPGGQRPFSPEAGAPGPLPGTGRQGGVPESARSGMAPGAGGYGGRPVGTGAPRTSQRQERERSAWPAEDRDVWEAGIDEVAAGVIGGLPSVVHEEERPPQPEPAEDLADSTSSSGPEAHDASEAHDEEDAELDRMLQELEAELDVEPAELNEGGFDADAMENTTQPLDGDHDGRLDGRRDGDTGRGDAPVPGVSSGGCTNGESLNGSGRSLKGRAQSSQSSTEASTAAFPACGAR